MSMSANAVASSSKFPDQAVQKSSKHLKHSHRHQGAADHQPNGIIPGQKQAKEKHSRRHDEQTNEQRRSKKEKGKEKDQSAPKTGPFEHRRSRMMMSIPPKFSGDYLVGVREQLDGMIMRYVPQMQGVLLAHWDHTFLDDTVKLLNECPFGVAEVEFEAIVWSPKIGQRLSGTHSLSSPSHLSLLFARTFNISIPLQHIPLDKYEFQASNPDDLDSDEEDTSDSESILGGPGGFGAGMNGEVEEVGRWKVKSTGKMVGEGGKSVKFTVIGMQVSNQMLSLIGSLLSDPTNPPPPPKVPSSQVHHARPDSPTPEPDDIPEPSSIPRPAKQPRPSKAPISQPTASVNATGVTGAPTAGAATPAIRSSTVQKEEIDERYLSARELKARRKEEERRKKEARKARKEERVLEAEQIVGGAMAVQIDGGAAAEAAAAAEVGKKKKRKSEAEGEKKSKKVKP